MLLEPVDQGPYQNILARFEPIERDDIFRVLGAVQDAYGYIPREVLDDISEKFHRPVAELYGAITGYPGFKAAPPEAPR